jgi:glycosyltransferase involved in cell wall biosynthesis
MNKEIIFSVIIPHKNIPDLLQRCLNSIPRREDVQIIVIDDNSDMDKVDFANFPGLNDPFVEVVFGKNENGRKGAGYARNLGLERAKGKWLIFADADDFFLPTINIALDEYKDNENDNIYFKTTSVDSDTLKPSTRHYGQNNILKKIQKTNNWNIAFKIVGSPSRFIKREIIEKNNICFQEVEYGNDILFSVKVLNNIKKNTISNFEIYCVTYRPDSLTSRRKESAVNRFHIRCDAVSYNKTYYLKRMAFTKWMVIFIYDDYKVAFKLFPKMVKVCGIIPVFLSMIDFSYRVLLNKIKKIKR